ncbi:MAG: hypothetical protein RL691_1089 [Actinomycetota bacterium]
MFDGKHNKCCSDARREIMMRRLLLAVTLIATASVAVVNVPAAQAQEVA